jgi:hypothetical protein
MLRHERTQLATVLRKLMAAAEDCDESERPGLDVAIAIVEWHLRSQDS